MTRKQALTELIEKVEAGDRSASLRDTPLKGNGGLYEGALNGSLDAAKALHDAVLPGWIGYADTTGFAWLYEDENESQTQSALIPSNPARAWLLAILRALHAMEA